MTTTYELHVQPFRIGDEKSQATKPLEKAAEAFGQWQLMTSRGKSSAFRGGVIYECCDTIQAACNLMARVGASSAEVSAVMEGVHASSECGALLGVGDGVEQMFVPNFCPCCGARVVRPDGE